MTSPPSERFPTGSGRPTNYKSKINVRVPETMVVKLAKVGNKEHLSMSDTIRLVIERGLKYRPERTS